MIRLLKHKLVQDSIILSGVQVSGYILPMVTLPYLTRVLGPSEFGLLALGTALVLYSAVVIEYGFPVTGTRRVAIAQQDLSQVWRVYSNVMACKVTLTTVCFIALAGVVWAVPKLHQHWPLYLISYLQAIGLCLSPNWLLQGMQRMKLVAASDYGGKLITVALIFLLVRHSSDYLIAAALQSGAFLIAAVFGLIVSAIALRIRLVAPSLREMREYMIEGWPVFLSFASGNVMNSSNTMIVGMMTTTEQVGFLNAASRLVIASRSLVNPLATAVYPHMSQLASRSPAEAVRFLKRRLFWTAAPFLLVSLGMLVLSPLAVRILYGVRFQESVILLRLMSPTPFVHALSMCFGTYFMLAFGYEKAWSKVVVLALGLNFVLIAVLVPFLLPARAIAVTGSLTDIFVMALCMRFFLRKVKTLAATEQSSSQ